MTILITVVLAPLVLLTLCFAAELFVGLCPMPQDEALSGIHGSTVIVVPAHDEEPIIARSLLKLRDAAGRRARILVVADNCSDSTAMIARECGVDVIERIDAQRRGKGYALDFARLELQPDPPEIVMIVDADCAIDSPSIERVIGACLATARPCQAVYLQSPVANGPPSVQLSTFAFFVRNEVRQRAMQRLAGRVHLVGTGMAFPWPLFDQIDLATGNIVEDLHMGLELADAGHAPLLVDDARIWSDAASEKATIDQRRRWEGGYFESAAKWAPRLLLRSLRRRDLRGLWAAINLFIPPLTLLVMLDLSALMVVLVFWLAGGPVWPFLSLTGSLLIAGFGLVLVWGFGGRRFVSLRGLAKIPFYLLWKMPLYVGLARQGAPKEWLRTSREKS